MSLVGNIYDNPSSADPGATGFGYGWAQSDTGNLYWRNTSDTAWVLAGNINQTYLGNLSRSGGTMTGALLGEHLLMPLAGGDFTVAPTINGNAIATVPYVNSQITSLNNSISTQIAQAIASVPGVSVSSNLAVLAGVSSALNDGASFTIPLPIYGDGTTATAAEVAGRYGIWFEKIPGGLLSGFNLVETPIGSRTYVYSSSGGAANGAILGYYIIGVKS